MRQTAPSGSTASPRSRMPAFAVALGALGAACALGCRKSEPPESSSPAASASTSAKPVDRLAPGELEPGEGDLFGLPIPRGMTIQGKFREFAIATGRVRPEAVANYVRDHVVVERVEIGAARTVFPAARIKGAPADRTYRLEVVTDGPATRLIVRDVTPAPPVHMEGLSTEELWRRAGYTRDGKPLNPKALE